jgi:hypothetical protein
MKVAIIGSAGIPAKYGGFETLAENLVVYRKPEINYVVFCSAKLYDVKPNVYRNSTLKYISLSANGVSSILYDSICMFRSLDSDIMLILGVSGSIFIPLIRLLYRGKIVTNVDGIEWKRQKWNTIAKYFLKLSESAAVKYSDIIIGDNQGIVDYIKKRYNKTAILIEYGADHAL